MSADAKVTVLKKILEEKDVLFGQFSESLTKLDKERKWEEVADEAKALGVLASGKSWTHLRDVIWQNWRKRALEKKDNRRKTGKGGGTKMVLTAFDDLVIEILGKDSPVIDGLQVAESSGSNVPELAIPTVDNNPTGIVAPEVTPPKKKNFALSSKRRLSTEEDDERRLKIRKLEAQTEALHLDNYKRHLEILEMEKKLDLPQSQLSKKFFEENYTN